MGRYLLTAVFKTRWRIASASPEEQAILDAHGFSSRTDSVTTMTNSDLVRVGGRSGTA
jgi:hypothetical protein